MIASIVAKFIVLTWLFRHLLNWNGLRMFQISAKINFKTKYEGFSNRPCAKHNEEQRESRRVSEWQSKLRTWKFHGNMYSWHKKMLIYSIISFVSGFFFLWTFWQLGPISVFSLCSFRFDVFLCKRVCFDGNNYSTTRFSSVLSCEDLLISSFHRSANMWNFHISKIFIHLNEISFYDWLPITWP